MMGYVPLQQNDGSVVTGCRPCSTGPSPSSQRLCTYGKAAVSINTLLTLL